MTQHDPMSRTTAPRPRRGLLTVLLAAVACSVCLLPALLTTATLAGVTGWVTGAGGLTVVAAVLVAVAGLIWQRRRGVGHQPPCECSNCV